MDVEDIQQRLDEGDKAIFDDMTPADRLIMTTLVATAKASKERWDRLETLSEARHARVETLERKMGNMPSVLVASMSEPEYTLMVGRVTLMWKASLGAFALLMSGLAALIINWFKG